MTSIVVSEVHHHLPYGRQHLPPHESSHSRTTHLTHPYKSAPAGPLQTNATGNNNNNLSSVAASMDTPMTDAGPRSSTSQSAPSQPQPLRTTSLEPPSTSTPQHGSMDPPPSPRFKGQSHTTPRAADFPQTRVVPSSPAHPSPNTSQSSIVPAASTPAKVKVKSLSHIQAFVLDEQNPLSQAGSRLARRDASDMAPQYEISEMPVTDIIEMVAGLLTKITTTNDKQHQHLHRQIPPPEGTVGMSPQTTSVLAFHGKNVPSISILSYLSRIHKYCPTTYEVFLSLLVYFDRMTERVNAGPLQDLRQSSQHNLDESKGSDGSRHSSVSSTALAQESPQVSTREPQQSGQTTTTPPPSGSLGKWSESVKNKVHNSPPSPPPVAEPSSSEEPYNFSHFFVVDSFNIHRLVIAGVTCASKFFSDIFYTNSRYAKVGGLPLPELNHLELQFLLLNDFRLAVPLEEMEAYGTMLVEFYAREVLANQHGALSSPESRVAVA